MSEAIDRATPTQRLLHARYAEIHRKFFPRPPVFPRTVTESPPPIVPAPEPPPPVSAREIGFQETKLRLAIMRRIISREFGVRIEDLTGTRRSADVVLPRHVYCYMAAHLARVSSTMIGRSLHQDHTSILHAVRRIEHRMKTEQALAERLHRLERRIRAQFGERIQPHGGRYVYVPINRAMDYLLLGWMWPNGAIINDYTAVFIWPCECRCVEPSV